MKLRLQQKVNIEDSPSKKEKEKQKQKIFEFEQDVNSSNSLSKAEIRHKVTGRERAMAFKTNSVISSMSMASVSVAQTLKTQLEIGKAMLSKNSKVNWIIGVLIVLSLFSVALNLSIKRVIDNNISNIKTFQTLTRTTK